MKYSVLILFFFMACYNKVISQSVNLAWVNALEGNSYDACKAIAIDDLGNVYATGYFSTTVDFDAKQTTFAITSVNAEDAFIAKYDNNGNFIWAKAIGDFRYQAGNAITLDNVGNIYVTGIFFGTTDFDPGPGIANLTSAGNEDIFITKFDNNGNFIWAKRFGGITNDFCNSIKIDAFGNILFNGYFENTVDFDPGTGVFNLTSAGSTDIFVCKLTSNGNFIWVKRIGGALADAAFDIDIDEQNNIYSTGFFWNTIDFDPGVNVFNLSSTALGDGFVLKLNPNGNFVNAIDLGGDSRVRCTSLKFDYFGNIYVAGHFDGQADFDGSSAMFLLNSPIDDDDIFIAKYTTDLNFIWTKQIVGESFQKAFDIDVDSIGNIYTTGHYNGTVDFDPGTAENKLTALGDPEVFVLKLKPTGEFVWVASTSGNFFGSGYSIKVDKSANIIVGGTFEGTKDFDPSSNIINRTSIGQSEIFIQKLKQCPNSIINEVQNVVTCSSYTLGTKVYDSSGLYTQYLQNSAGCDSVSIKLNLTINRIKNNKSVSICEGERYFAGGKNQTKSGIYIDTLKTTTNCDSLIITQLSVNKKPVFTLGIGTNFCEGDTVILKPGNYRTYLWQDLSMLPYYNVTKLGTYSVVVSDTNNCIAASRITFRSLVKKPTNFLSNNADLCLGNSLKLEVPNYKNYFWNTGQTGSSIEINNGGIYSLKVTDYNNCVGVDTITVKEVICKDFLIPNTFSPNNDGKNEIFKPIINIPIKNYLFQIFDRSGNMLFKTSDLLAGWDGKYKNQPMPIANYIYLLTFINSQNVKYHKTGNILLIR